MRKGEGRMYINPFWAGVLLTLLVIFGTFIVLSVIKYRKSKRGGK